MSTATPVPQNVLDFLDRASDDVASLEADRFSQDMFCQIQDVSIQSPIEQLFWIAMHVMCMANFDAVNPDPLGDGVNDLRLGFGVHIEPQHKIGKYRVDFLLKRTNLYGQVVDQVIVELDGHAFHDKDKHQRSYEKARDRFFVKAGYKVLHYTGSDVAADPYRVAHEVMDALHCFGGGVGEVPYKAGNPFSGGGLY